MTDQELKIIEKEVENRQKKEKKEKKRSPMAPILSFLVHAFVFVVVVYLIFAGVFGLKTAPNNDMHPRIDQGDLIFFYRLDKEPKAQDVIVFTKNDTTYVGRVVAVGGESVNVTNAGSLYINERSVVEPDIFYPTPPYEGFVNYPLQLEKDQYFVLVDYRDGGEDSRYFGPINQDDIHGTVLAVLRRNVI